MRKGEVSTAQADRAIETLPDLFSQIVRSTDLIRDAWRIAEALDHSVYDCLYLACAEQRGVKLVTADDRFRDKARSREGPIAQTRLPRHSAQCRRRTLILISRAPWPS